jgi:hypothetical protein
VDEATIRFCVRLTARASAVLFASAGMLRAVELFRRSTPAISSRALLVGFLASHTVHFAFVLMLAAATRGANIAERHGWLANGVVGVLFYAGLIGMIVSRRPGRRDERLRPRLAFELVANLLIAGGFLFAYVGRAVADPFFVPWVALVVAGALAHFFAVSISFAHTFVTAAADRIHR